LVERSDELLKKAKAEGISVLDPQVHDVRIGTIHSLCDALLAEFDPVYMAAGTQLIDEMETTVRLARNFRWALGYQAPPAPKRVVNRLLQNENLTCLFHAPWVSNANWPAKTMDRIGCLEAILSQHTETWIPRCGASLTANGIEFTHGPKGLTQDLIKLQQRWEAYLDQNNILDFSTIQKKFLDRQPTIPDALTHVFVDEFQDNNPIQFAIHTGWLNRENIRLTVVGDDDQALYRFRGSDIACFNELEPFCMSHSVPYRREKLETNYRSTHAVVDFSQKFKAQTVLRTLSMAKQIRASSHAVRGKPVRLLQGCWVQLCRVVAQELHSRGVGQVPTEGQSAPDSAALLMFSTSEQSTKSHESAALALRQAMENKGIRVYNPRNKMAASPDSPVAELLGIFSYLIDPISLAPAGKNGRYVEVAASMKDAQRRSFALALPPSFNISESHLGFQKKFLKGEGGGIGQVAPARKPLLDYADLIRDELLKANRVGRNARLTLAGFVARLLSFDRFRNSGYTQKLFRQALFTALLEANVAPTRLTKDSLDQPLEVALDKRKKYVWPRRFWSLLNVLGSFLSDTRLDDPEVEAFEQHAVLMLTFHQAKGLEFDHVYVASTGREPDLNPALLTELFSGKRVKYKQVGGKVSTRDPATLQLALADREREVYVAITRAKKTLTILDDPDDNFSHRSLNPAIEKLFLGRSKTRRHLAKLGLKEFYA